MWLFPQLGMRLCVCVVVSPAGYEAMCVWLFPQLVFNWTVNLKEDSSNPVPVLSVRR